MNTRWFRLLIGPMIALTAVAAGCSSAASVAPSTQPQPSAAAPSVATAPSPDPSPAAPPALTETFTSKLNGISISYPAGWITRPATEPWTGSGWNFDDPRVDIVNDPSLADHLFLALGSAPLGGTSADQWIRESAAANECGATEPVTVDGASGSICEGGDLALVSTGGRGYLIRLYTSGDEGWLDSVYDRAWFERILASVKLQP